MKSKQTSRRDVLKASAALAAASPFFATALQATAPEKRPKILFFTKSSGFEHSVVKREGDSPAYAERVLKEFAGAAGFDVEATKDGTVFDGDIDQYAAFFFYNDRGFDAGRQRQESSHVGKGKARFLEAIAAGKGMMAATVRAIHSTRRAIVAKHRDSRPLYRHAGRRVH